jgi:hypothetical protein
MRSDKEVCCEQQKCTSQINADESSKTPHDCHENGSGLEGDKQPAMQSVVNVEEGLDGDSSDVEYFGSKEGLQGEYVEEMDSSLIVDRGKDKAFESSLHKQKVSGEGSVDNDLEDGEIPPDSEPASDGIQQQTVEVIDITEDPGRADQGNSGGEKNLEKNRLTNGSGTSTSRAQILERILSKFSWHVKYDKSIPPQLNGKATKKRLNRISARLLKLEKADGQMMVDKSPNELEADIFFLTRLISGHKDHSPSLEVRRILA